MIYAIGSGAFVVVWLVLALFAARYAYGSARHADVTFAILWPWRTLPERWAREDNAAEQREMSWRPPLPAPVDDRLCWEWDDDAREAAFAKWLEDSRVGTVEEILQACYHESAVVVFDETHKATIGTIVRARCNWCHASTVASMDDWLDSRYKLSSYVRKCCSGIDPNLCSCGPCQRRREPTPVRDFDYYGHDS